MIPVNWATSLSLLWDWRRPNPTQFSWPPLRQGYRPCLWKKCTGKGNHWYREQSHDLAWTSGANRHVYAKGTAVPGAITKLGQPHPALLIQPPTCCKHKVTALLESKGQLPLPCKCSTLYVWIDIKRAEMPSLWVWGPCSPLSTCHIPTAFCSYPASKILFMFSNVKNDICSLWVIYADVYYTEIHKN